MTPNLFGTLVLAAYPLFALALFLLCRPQVAVAVTLLVGEMFLPANFRFDFALIPHLDKQTIPAFSAFAWALIFGRRRLSRPFRGVEFLFLLMIVSMFVTVRTNGDPLTFGPLVLPGETLHDYISALLRVLLIYWIPFFLGRCMFRTSRDLISLARVMTIAALLYSFPILIEIRLSPQLCGWVYGYAAYGFDMVRRWGGYRPVVFFMNGLFLSVFMLVLTVMAVALTRIHKRAAGLPMLPVSLYLCLILIACKSSGTIVYALAFLPLLAFASPVRSMSVATIVSICVLAYPLLRLWDVIPTAKIVELISGINSDRAGSLLYRFNMEQGILDKLRDRLAFGWGGWGRPFLFNSNGHPLTTVDGFAIIELSARGLVGYLCFFGIFITPVIQARRFLKRIQDRSSRILICGLALTVAILLFDMTMNAPNNPFLTMLAGALSGAVPGILAEEAALTRSIELEEATASLVPDDDDLSPEISTARQHFDA